MGKFNNSTEGSTKTINYAGGSAYKIQDEKLSLITQCLSCFVNENKYYKDNTNDIINKIRMMIEVDAKFVGNLAIYCRNELYLRSITHVIIGEMAFSVKGKPYVRKLMNMVIERPDDMTEILAYYLNTYGKPIPNSIKKGLSDAIKKFDEYSLAKYNRENRRIKLKDILKICHPKSNTKEEGELLGKILNDTLKTPTTWETQLSSGGNKKEVWEDLIEGRHLGYFACIRNLRNIIDKQPSNFDKVLSFIQNKNAIYKNKLLPFRYYTAYKEIQNHPYASSKVLDALENAMDISINNINKFKGKTLLVCDNSGSMSNNMVSNNSSVSCKEIANLMTSIAHKFCEDAVTMVFGTEINIVNVSNRNGIISNMRTFRDTYVGRATYLNKVFDWLVNDEVYFDRIIIFSDMQTYTDQRAIENNAKTPQQSLDIYKLIVNPNVYLHSIDLAGYGSAQFIGKNINLLASRRGRQQQRDTGRVNCKATRRKTKNSRMLIEHR